MALKLKQQGLNNSQIVDNLNGQGYDSQQIAESMNQLGIKNSIESGYSSNNMQPSLLDEDDIPVPAPPQSESRYESHAAAYSPSSSQSRMDFQQQIDLGASNQSDMQEIVESIVEEKWQRFSDSITDFEVWKSRVNDDVVSIKQEVIRVANRFDILQKAVLGKVDEYNRSITDVGSEIKALEKVFQNIMEPLTSNIKELSRITKDLKK